MGLEYSQDLSEGIESFISSIFTPEKVSDKNFSLEIIFTMRKRSIFIKSIQQIEIIKAADFAYTSPLREHF